MDLCLTARLLSDRPAGLVGHSFGGGEATFAASLCPDQFSWVVNLDGLGPPEGELAMPDIAEAAQAGVQRKALARIGEQRRRVVAVQRLQGAPYKIGFARDLREVAPDTETAGRGREA